MSQLERVHLAHPGGDILRVLDPLRVLPCDRLVLCQYAVETGSYYARVRQEITRRVLDSRLSRDVVEETLDFAEIPSLVAGICTLINREAARGNEVWINISCGSHLFSAASALS